MSSTHVLILLIILQSANHPEDPSCHPPLPKPDVLVLSASPAAAAASAAASVAAARWGCGSHNCFSVLACVRLGHLMLGDGFGYVLVVVLLNG